MTHRIRTLLAAALCLGAAAGATAGVTVHYVDADKFSDLPRTPWQRTQALDDFADHFRKLGEGLAPGQDLVIDVLDIDLAGREEPNGLGSDDLRIIRGGADWPRMHLRYTLSAGGQVLASGDAQLSDKGFTDHINAYPRDARWPYEKQMIDAWWDKTIKPLAAAGH